MEEEGRVGDKKDAARTPLRKTELLPELARAGTIGSKSEKDRRMLHTVKIRKRERERAVNETTGLATFGTDNGANARAEGERERCALVRAG